jgi:hypothetical protein
LEITATEQGEAGKRAGSKKKPKGIARKMMSLLPLKGKTERGK